MGRAPQSLGAPPHEACHDYCRPAFPPPRPLRARGRAARLHRARRGGGRACRTRVRRPVRRRPGRRPARHDQLLDHLERQGRQDLLLQGRRCEEVLPGKSGAEPAEGARLRRREQRRVDREGHAGLRERRCRDAREGLRRCAAQGQRRRVPARGPAERHAAEARLRRHRFHAHHRRLRLLPRREVPRRQGRGQALPDRFLGGARPTACSRCRRCASTRSRSRPRASGS